MTKKKRKGRKGASKPKRKRKKLIDNVEKAFKNLDNKKKTKAWKGAEVTGRGPFNKSHKSNELIKLVIKDYLTHSREYQDTPSQTVRFHQALERIANTDNGYSFLKEFNLKTTPYRVLNRALWDVCEMPKGNDDLNKGLRAKQTAETKSVINAMNEYTNIKPEKIPKVFTNELNEKEAEKLNKQLEKNGIVCVSKFVNVKTCKYLLSNINNHVKKNNEPTKLRITTGLGQCGVYYNKDFNLTALKKIQTELVDKMKLPTNSKNSKTILLGYGEGGVNWAHQDSNPDYPYQALLMLSEPGPDFLGGQLYSLNGGENFKKTKSGIENQGDVCIFKSNGKFYHGMERVKKGTKERVDIEKGTEDPALTCRIACGLFHKNT